MKKLHYETSGDNYKIKDPFKIFALNTARKTAKNLRRFRSDGLLIEEVKSSRGDSAYRLQLKTTCAVNFQIAYVEEGLGTKNIIADELFEIYGKKVYESVAIDNASSIFNDLSTTGASPLSFMLHVAAYPTEWFTDKNKAESIILGTFKACNSAGASWGGGESATMRDVIIKGKALLSGSAIGVINPSEKALTDSKLRNGDRIILLESSGVHTNGITLLRKELVRKLPNGYLTKLKNGKTYGESLLTPSIIYSSTIEKLLKKVDLHYASHITGHGWRKIMRSKRSFTYVIESLPKPQSIFELIQQFSNSSDTDMYDTYNMGAGFALFVNKNDTKKVLNICKQNGIKGIDAGYLKKGPRRVVIQPKGIVFEGDTLQIR